MDERKKCTGENMLSIINNEVRKYLQTIAGESVEHYSGLSKQNILDKLIMNYKKKRDCYINNIRLAMKYYRKIEEALSQLNYGIVSIDAEVDNSTRLLIGSAQGLLASIFEVGLNWDHIMDLPFIPASSLKGATKAALRELISEELIYKLFGDETNKTPGCITFFDSYPVEAPNGLIEPDIITPHYYKGGNVVKTELEAEPTPIIHVSIPSGTKFRILATHRCEKDLLLQAVKALGLKDNYAPELIIASIVAIGLANGVGARVSRGYGFLKISRISIRR